jgi:RNA polymerase sigma-70 factor (ECF subfamily)
MPATAVSVPSAEEDLGELYEAHVDFVWKSLARMGVREADRADVAHDVFVVVGRQLSGRRGTSSMRTWLYGICLRVASAYRRRAFRQREHSVGQVPETGEAGPHSGVEVPSPENALERRRTQEALARALDELPVARRALLVMYEVDDLSCSEIAEILGVPVGTVHSRLHKARNQLRRAFRRTEPGRAGGRR